MKIVFLNVLHAELAAPLGEFLREHRDTADVFCFQEADGAMLGLMQELLPGFAQVAATKPEPGCDDLFNNVTLVRDTLAIEASSLNAGSLEVGLALYVSVRSGDKTVHIANVHGITKPGKLDLPSRIRQSQEILDTIEAAEGIRIVGGDLNVLPETQSVRLFEEAGYKNLIRDFNIETTRNHVAWEKYPGNELLYSDYVFVKGAGVASFKVPERIVSDHQPMIVTLDLAQKSHETPDGQSTVRGDTGVQLQCLQEAAKGRG